MTPLTPAQLLALADAAAGLTAPQAAAMRGQSPRTVHTLRAQAIRRLGARNVVNAVYCAAVMGLIPPTLICENTMSDSTNVAVPDIGLYEYQPDAPAPMTRVSRELAAQDRAQMERRR